MISTRENKAENELGVVDSGVTILNRVLTESLKESVKSE